MRRETIISAFIVSCLSAGCGNTSDTQRTPPPPNPAPVVQQAPPHMEFETKTDTIHALKSKPGVPAGTRTNELQIRYMVQIGAFKNPQNASRVQVSARERYHMPVLNDFDARWGLYQIRIGFFESEEAARAFCERLQKEYPKDYRDSWVIHLKR